MDVFSNIKINSLRKKIEDPYKLRLKNLGLNQKNLPNDQRAEMANKLILSLQSTEFGNIMNFLLFRPDVGVFKDDIDNLDEFRFNQLYQKMIVWYSWARISENSEGGKNQEGMNFCINSLEMCLGINPALTRTLYNGLVGLSINLVPFALFRWCMLDVGHVDSYYETMHENSPDCIKFILTAKTAFLEVDESLKKP